MATWVQSPVEGVCRASRLNFTLWPPTISRLLLTFWQTLIHDTYIVPRGRMQQLLMGIHISRVIGVSCYILSFRMVALQKWWASFDFKEVWQIATWYRGGICLRRRLLHRWLYGASYIIPLVVAMRFGCIAFWKVWWLYIYIVFVQWNISMELIWWDVFTYNVCS